VRSRYILLSLERETRERERERERGGERERERERYGGEGNRHLLIRQSMNFIPGNDPRLKITAQPRKGFPVTSTSLCHHPPPPAPPPPREEGEKFFEPRAILRYPRIAVILGRAEVQQLNYFPRPGTTALKSPPGRRKAAPFCRVGPGFVGFVPQKSSPKRARADRKSTTFLRKEGQGNERQEFSNRVNQVL